MKSRNLFGEGVRGLLNLNLTTKHRLDLVWLQVEQDETLFSVFANIYQPESSKGVRFTPP